MSCMSGTAGALRSGRVSGIRFMSGTTNGARFEAPQTPAITPANNADDLIQAVAQRAHDAANETLRPRQSGRANSEIAVGPRIADPVSELGLSVTAKPSLARRAARRMLRFAFVLFLGVASTLAWQAYGETAKHMVVTGFAAWAMGQAPPVCRALRPIACCRGAECTAGSRDV